MTLKVIFAIVVLSLVGWFLLQKNANQTTTSVSNQSSFPKPQKSPNDPEFTRVTKKPFGIYITPKTSPVQPEKFTGFHTGIDFETLPNEQDLDIQVHAVCTGELLMKKYASGYGGLAVQECTVDNQALTIIYGHLKLESISSLQGVTLQAQDVIGILGKGYSSETDGERKHLHLGVHKGSYLEIKGYVQNKTDLSYWLDPEVLVKEGKIATPI